MLLRARPILSKHLSNKWKGNLCTGPSSTIFLCDHTQFHTRSVMQEVFCPCAVRLWPRIFWMACIQSWNAWDFNWVWWLPEQHRKLCSCYYKLISDDVEQMHVNSCADFFFFHSLAKVTHSETVDWKCRNFISKVCLTGPKNRLSNKFIGTKINIPT